MSDKKLQEAVKHVQAAEKSLKTSFLKWKPDYDSAAAEYTKAGIAYKNANALSEAKNVYEKAADCQLQCSQLFHAAKSYEQAGLIARDLKNLDECAKLMERACSMFVENGTPDTAVLTLTRAAKMVEAELPDRAVNLYYKAANIYDVESNPKQAADVIRGAPRLLIRHKKYDEAVNALQREINYNAEAGEPGNFQLIHRLVTCMVLLHLYRGDCVAADKAYKHAYAHSGFGESDDATMVEQLLDAVNQGDEDGAKRLLNQPLFKYLDNDFAKLARDLRESPPDGLYMSGGGAVDKTSDAAPAGATAANEEQEDEYPDGLL